MSQALSKPMPAAAVPGGGAGRLALELESTAQFLLFEPGLYAIAIRVIRSPYWGAQCFTDIYLHSGVDFDYPEGTAGSFADTTNYGLMFFLGDMSKADSRYRGDRWHKERWR